MKDEEKRRREEWPSLECKHNAVWHSATRHKIVMCIIPQRLKGDPILCHGVIHNRQAPIRRHLRQRSYHVLVVTLCDCVTF